MKLDIYTLFICELYVLGFLSIILVFAWIGSRYDRVLGYTFLALSTTLLAVLLSSLRSSGLHFLPVAVGNIMMMLAYGALLNAFLTFSKKRLGYYWLAGALLWAILCCFPSFYYSQPRRVILICLICVIYTVWMISLIWQTRDTLKITFWPAQWLLWIHVLFHIARIFLDDAIPSTVKGDIGGSSFSVYVILESILFVIGLAFTLLAMVNERTQIIHLRASLEDPLTNVGNRRALFEQAEKILTERQARKKPVSALLFDLDHFKSINDRFGHQQGDRVLIDFCQLVGKLLPENSHFSRLGGEEFAMVVAADTDEVRALCEKIRVATYQSRPDGIHYSVSIGFVTSSTMQSFDTLLALADEALYRAKASGRNRTEQYVVLQHSTIRSVL